MTEKLESAFLPLTPLFYIKKNPYDFHSVYKVRSQRRIGRKEQKEKKSKGKKRNWKKKRKEKQNRVIDSRSLLF